MLHDWKPLIISYTETDEARSAKIDASFFPPVPPANLEAWERQYAISIPAELRSYAAQSDGLEVAHGLFWPVLPLAQWEYIEDLCATPHPWIAFGEGPQHRYLLSLGHSPSIYRYERFGSDESFFAANFHAYIKEVFSGRT